MRELLVRGQVGVLAESITTSLCLPSPGWERGRKELCVPLPLQQTNAPHLHQQRGELGPPVVQHHQELRGGQEVDLLLHTSVFGLQTMTAPSTESPVSSPSSTRSLNSTPAPTWRRPGGSSGVPAQTTMTGTISGATALPETGDSPRARRRQNDDI
ncbi:unnamed protein product [Caretta caretta]